MARMRAGSAVVLGVSVAMLLAACTGDNGEETPEAPENTDEPEQAEDVTITWWHNGTGEPLLGFWQEVADEFEAANPGVTVEVSAFQNEELQRTLIPNALRSNDPPDVFQQWGAGEMAQQVEAGYLRDITDDVSAEVDMLNAVSPWQLEGRTYGLPFSFGIEGFWYNTELFEQAGIDGKPETLEDLYSAIDALKAAGITPIAVGAGDNWPAAHYWYNFALKSCPPEVLENAQANKEFEDPCFVRAGELLQEFIASAPFQEGFLATSAQQGAGSSAGMVATGSAAMELMGHWNPGVMGGILAEETGDENATPPEFLGWFNFPAVEGDGDPTAALGGGDGFSVSAAAPDAAVDLLKYIVSADVQSRFGEIGAGIPTNPEAADSVTDPNLQLVLEGLNEADYVQLWLDTAYGPVIGDEMNRSVVALFNGQETPQGIVDAMQAAAETL